MTPKDFISSLNRIVVRGTLTLDGSFHIGSGSASRQSDMALRRDAQGRVYIPGSSLAGLLRSTAEDLAPYVAGAAVCSDRHDACLTCSLFGWTSSKGQSGGGQAAHLTMLDALPIQASSPVVEVRNHVGIDRQYSTAREGLFYNREVAPANSSFSFEFQVQEPSADELRLLIAALDLWAVSGVRLGGRTTTGLGLAFLKEIQWFGLDFSDDKLLLDYLLPPTQLPNGQEYLPTQPMDRDELVKKVGKASQITAPIGGVERYLPQRIIIELELQAEEPLLVVGYTPKIAVQTERPTDAAFVNRLVYNANGKVVDELFLPGSGFKGVLRTRAEKIVRTLDYYTGFPKQEDAWNDPHSPEKYTQRISACAITHALAAGETSSRLSACFGGVRMQNTENQEEPTLYDHSCIACRLFGNTALRGRLVVGDGRLLTEGKAKLFDHVAIDRFSGGAADAKKFDDRPLLPGERFSITLELQRPEPWMAGLIALLLKDLSDGDFYLGHATHRGYGRVRAWVTRSTILALPGSQLYGSLAKAGFPEKEKTEEGAFWQVNLGLGTLFTRDGVYSSAGPASNWLEVCHQEFLAMHSAVQHIQDVGEVMEVRQ